MTFSKPRRPTFILAAAAVVLGGSVVARAQSPGSTVWSGVYTDEQADRGKAAYAANCASCHGDTLAGIDVAPPLTGAGFLNNWNGTSAGDLFNRIKTTMPLNAPATLSGRTVADIEAFIFKANGFPAGQVALPSAPPMMANMKIVSQKPAN